MSSNTLRERVVTASDAELAALLSFFSAPPDLRQYYTGLLELVRAEQARRRRGGAGA